MRGRRNSGTSGRKDVINKQHLDFVLNLQFTIFGGQEKGMMKGMPVDVFSLGTKVFGVFYYLASPLGYTRLRRVPCESFIMPVCYIFSITQNGLSLSRK